MFPIRFPIIDWLVGYQKKYFAHDIFSGLTVGVFLIPQGMAYALLAGLPPVYGLYASIFPPILYAIFGTSRQLSVAPVAMDSLLVAAGISVWATLGSPTYIEYALLLAMLTGLFQLCFGFFKMGFITYFLSKPVISGFTFAAALIISINQLKYFLGLPNINSFNIFNIIQHVFSHIKEIHIYTLILGLSAMVIIAGVKKISVKIPGSLLVVLLSIAFVYFFDLEPLGIRIIKTIPEGLPRFSIPNLAFSRIYQLLPLAFTLAIIGYMEAFSISKVLEKKAKKLTLDPNQEFFALGSANSVGSVFQSFPVTGGFSRSAVNFQAGAKTPFSSLVSAVIVMLTLLFFTPIFYYLPYTILAAIIMIAVLGLVDTQYIRKTWQNDKLDTLNVGSTLIFTLIFGMVKGLLLGIFFSIFLLLVQEVINKNRGLQTLKIAFHFKHQVIEGHTLMVQGGGSLFFLNVPFLKKNILKNLTDKIDKVILNANAIRFLDSTAHEFLEEIVFLLNERNIKFILENVSEPLSEKMKNSELFSIIGNKNIQFQQKKTL